MNVLLRYKNEIIENKLSVFIRVTIFYSKIKDFRFEIPQTSKNADEDVQTMEFAFLSTDGAESKFAETGDSGALVYIHEDKRNKENEDQVVGLIIAVTDRDSFLVFVTPIQNILNDLKDKHNKTFNFSI